MKYHLVVLAVLVALASCNAEADWVDPNELPIGLFVQPFFSGYLDIDSTRRFFYTYHPSQNNPTKDPVVVWFGSGPGCSALYSMFYSKGPFTLMRNSTDFMHNNNNWNKQANVVFIEAPASVGFSVGPPKSSDYEQGEENLKALVSFFRKFPDLKDQDLYLAGEGYSGVVVPWTANRTLEWNVSPYTPPYERIRLRGLFLGNPCTHPSECYKQGNNIHSYRFLSNHYYYTRAQYEAFELACMGIEQPGCADVKKNMDNFFLSTGVNRRNIYEKCLKQHSEGYPDLPCLDQTGILKWLNDEQMRKAMHVNVSTTTKWTVCNEDVELSYFKDPRGSYFLYPSLIQANLRLFIYSGVLDASNPVTGTMRWIEQLRQGQQLATLRPWAGWNMNDVNGGDVWEMRGLTVATVRSAGHMVFTDEPELGYYLLDSFLKNKQL